ncbi:bifunctional [glutamine synthetase] adenylyltransferase/[glutamine synthetase]-adenylyl-L-tyrosine phosphorylase [Metallococcus carri]|uniref:bifunctional [glutamine synthetase] adenylyltransferase/[glutamine synthetase]-adenylyl-L-tyrosine phosphorylase n=1 Tax=Metallococcus carri TaxID=1656884 RepID=UPI002E285BE5|nr:bifunctional [glutamine synthetase] adenylyltransferase/[glutamine synthetase]-adenylyl-L-tyrosine phosphorylase [Metallococcus carri]
MSRTDLIKAGATDSARAAALLDELGDWAAPDLLELLPQSADPDQSLLGLVRLKEADDAVWRPLDGAGRLRLVTVLGASSALTDHLVRRPEQVADLAEAALGDRAAYVDLLRADVGERTGTEARDALRVAYRRRLVQIAAIDTSGSATDLLPRVAEALADLASATLQVALDIATREQDDAADARLSIIAMGKCGARELNYLSDVDVIFAAEPADGVDEAHALEVATRLATEVMRICSEHTGEGTLWQVDAALRPEGNQGPLVRTVRSHQQYYERWAKTWEFQALLKARPVAGDAEVGQAYLEAMQPFVWQASSRDNFVEDVQAMRRRVEDHVPRGEAARQIKLGAGGLRDVEFSMQLLQLVHGRTDDRLRLRSTLAAIDALSRRGYIGRTDAAALDEAYRFLRALEHRIQLSKLRRTHLMPTSEAELRRVGRGLGFRETPEEAVVTRWKETAREVRRLHERIFYRPLLSAVAKLSDDDARLTLEGAQDRLAALGFRDPKGAMRHLEALMSGVSRRAAIQRTLLPVMLPWFASEVDPDQGLLAFRRISDELGGSHWYLKMLRDEGSAAETLARALAKSRYVADLLERAPSAVALVGEAGSLTPIDREAIITAMRAAAARQDDDEQAIVGLRSTRRTELIRIALADLSGTIGLDEVEIALTDLTAATLHVALEVAIRSVEAGLDRPFATDIAIIGMGRLGGREVGYASDADVMFVHRPRDGADVADAQADAEAAIAFLRKHLSSSGPDPVLGVDADLRPEGKAGPIVRTFDSYAAYYERWSEGWEAQALLRATPVAGDAQLGADFIELINPLRWPEGGIPEQAVRQIRTLKARMEAERIPRGGDKRTHFKLGIGGLADVEWTVQLTQLQHAHAVPELRRTGTATTLQVMADHGLISQEDADQLRDSWTLATRLRNASVLWRGRPVDALPSDLHDANGIARVLGSPVGTGHQLSERYLRAARKARKVVDRVFYGVVADNGWDRNPTRR